MKSLSAFIAASLWLSGAVSDQGQETWGGDIVALNFVKRGRALAEGIKNNKNCVLRRQFPLSALTKSIEKHEVVTTHTDKPDDANHLFVNRYKWYGLPSHEKNLSVAEKYTGIKLSGIGEKELKDCVDGKSWKKVEVTHPDEIVDLKLDIVKDARAVSQDLVKILRTGTLAPHLNMSDVRKMKSASENALISTSPTNIKFKGNAVKDGLNNRKNTILINAVTWRKLSHGEKMELLLHEYLNMIGVNDQRYQLSSHLFLALNEKYYL